MRYPSITTIATALDIERATAAKVRRMIDGTDNPDDNASVARWRAQCLHEPDDTAKRLLAINDIIGGHGVEAIRGADWGNRYYGNVRASYVNQGDTYDMTVILDHVRGRWLISSWGNVVEAEPAAYEEEG